MACAWDSGQHGGGGMRKVPQSSHWAAVRRRSFAACQNGSVTGLVVMWIVSDGSAVASVFVLMSHAPGSSSEEHTSELQSLMRISYAVFCLKKKRQQHILDQKH